MAPQPVAKRMFGEKPGKDWYVQCKHPDNSDEVVQVKQLTTHRPRDVNDFEKGEKYEIESTKWTKGHRCFYRVYIGRIAKTKKELDASIKAKRCHWPKLDPRDSDDVGSASEVERMRSLPNKESPAEIDAKKRKAREHDLQDLRNFVKKPKNCKVNTASDLSKVKKSSSTSKVITNTKSSENSTCEKPQRNKTKSQIKTTDLKVKTCNPKFVNGTAQVKKPALHSGIKSSSESDRQADVIPQVPTPSDSQEANMHQPSSTVTPDQTCSQKETSLPVCLESHSNEPGPILSCSVSGSGSVMSETTYYGSNNSDFIVADASQTTISQVSSLVQTPSTSQNSQSPNGNIPQSISLLSHDSGVVSMANPASEPTAEFLVMEGGALQPVNPGLFALMRQITSSIEDLRKEVKELKSGVQGDLDTMHERLGNMEQCITQISGPLPQLTVGGSCSRPSSRPSSRPFSRPSLSETGVMLSRSHSGTSATSASCTSAGALLSQKVQMGEGVECSRVNYDLLSTTNDLRDWCHALLEGVFGADTAKLMRSSLTVKSAKNLQLFPQNFRTVAMAYYGEFLERNNLAAAPVPKRIKRLVMGKLSKVCRDYLGRRNKPKEDPKLKLTGGKSAGPVGTYARSIKAEIEEDEEDDNKDGDKQDDEEDDEEEDEEDDEEDDEEEDDDIQILSNN